MIAYHRGQLWSKHSKSKQVLNAYNRCIKSHQDKRCFYNVDSWMRFFLFFIETDKTIGYGHRSISPHCPEAILVFVIQCLWGSFINAFTLGSIFVKLSRPKNETAKKIYFSNKAVLCYKDGNKTLMFRLANVMSCMIIQCKFVAKIIVHKQTLEGESIPLHQIPLNFNMDGGGDSMFLIKPLIVGHLIDSNSPLSQFSYQDIDKKHFEIVIVLHGIVEATGALFQATTSYLNSEIVCGHRFKSILYKDDARSKRKFKIDWKIFNSTYQVECVDPNCPKQPQNRRDRLRRESSKKRSSYKKVSCNFYHLEGQNYEDC